MDIQCEEGLEQRPVNVAELGEPHAISIPNVKQDTALSSPGTAIDDVAQEADDRFSISMKEKALSVGLKDVCFLRCADDYYSWSLDRRREYLGAPTTDHLCKSIVVCNTHCTNDDCSDPLNSKYYCIIVQYHTKFSASGIMRMIKKLQADAGRKPLGIKKLHFRMAEDCLGVTGFPPNGVTPIGLKTSMPIVLDRVITKLEPAVFWMGAGEVSLKVRVSLDEFCAAFKPIIGDVTPL